MKRSLALIVLLASTTVASMASAASYIAASCSGLTSNNSAISIKLRRGITDGPATSLIEMYVQDLSEPNLPNNYLGGMDCATDKLVGDEIVCETTLGETYKIHTKSLTATESGVGVDAKQYSYTFTTCSVADSALPAVKTNRNDPAYPGYLSRGYRGHIPP